MMEGEDRGREGRGEGFIEVSFRPCIWCRSFFLSINLPTIFPPLLLYGFYVHIPVYPPLPPSPLLNRHHAD